LESSFALDTRAAAVENALEPHNKLSFWKKMNMEEIAGDLMREDKKIMETYN